MNNLQRKPLFSPTTVRINPADRLALAQLAKQCIDWLFISGFEVLQVTKGLDKPRVFIRNSPLCKTLDGAIHRYERSLQGESRYYFAIRHNCEVRWNDAEVNS